jgi:membrane associated rhomboid family serine protease
MPEGIKWLIIANVAVYAIYSLTVRYASSNWFAPFELVPSDVLSRGWLWQFATYLFLHDAGSVWHLVFNMLMLWMFGKDLEIGWGKQRFLQFYFVCGMGAGLCVVLGHLLFGNVHSRTIGASGAIYGLLLAYGVLFPDREILMNLFFPIKAKYFVMIMGAVAFWNSITAPGGTVSHIAHLGGMIFAYFYLRSSLRQFDVAGILRHAYKDWKLRRAKRNFEVYMRKQSHRDIQ